MAPAADAGTITLGDLTVNRMGYGAMRITGPGIWGDPPDPEASKGVLRRTLELGVNFIDTASAYEASERLIGEALAPYSDGVVVASKAGLYRTGPGEWPIDSSPEAIRRQTEQSLRALHVERIDLHQLHRPDPKVPIEESVGALKELQDGGEIRHIGVSHVTFGLPRRGPGPWRGVVPRRRLFIAVLLAGSFAAPAGAAPTLLAPGITYERQVEFTPHGPVVLHVITAPKPDGSLYRLLPVLSNNAIVAT